VSDGAYHPCLEEEIHECVPGLAVIRTMHAVVQHERHHRVLVAFGKNGIGLAGYAFVPVVLHLIVHDLLKRVVVIHELFVIAEFKDDGAWPRPFHIPVEHLVGGDHLPQVTGVHDVPVRHGIVRLRIGFVEQRLKRRNSLACFSPV